MHTIVGSAYATLIAPKKGMLATHQSLNQVTSFEVTHRTFHIVIVELTQKARIHFQQKQIEKSHFANCVQILSF